MEPGPIPAATRRAVDTALDAATESDEALESVVARALARASRQLAVVAVRPQSCMRVDRIELVALEGGLLLLAVGGADGPLPTTTWKPSSGSERTLVPHAERWIRARLPVAGAPGLRALAGRARAEATADRGAYLADVLGRAARLLESREQTAVQIEGADHIASQPEFQSASRLRALVSLLSERAPLTRALESFAESRRPRVSIGRENGAGAIQDCSLVGRGIEIHGQRGSLGVLGPVRMPYPLLVSLVAYLGERLVERH